MRKGLYVLVILTFCFFVFYAHRQILRKKEPSIVIKNTTVENQKKEHIELKGDAVKIPLKSPQGFVVSVFADKLERPRDLMVSPGGTLLVSVPAKGQVLALIDKNNDGKADEVKTVLQNLNKPHGLGMQKNYLFVAEETQLVRYLWDEIKSEARLDRKLFDLPAGGRHTTRTITFSGDSMYVSIGSSCDTCVEKHPWLASVIRSDIEGQNPVVYASGLRNAVFITANLQTGAIWSVDMGRDFLGDNIPPDEINVLYEGKNYGWPHCYGDRIFDPTLSGESSFCTNTEPPVYKIQAHSAPLGLIFINSPMFPQSWQGDLLVSYHGSWNRSTPVGYKVVRLKVSGEHIIGVEDFLTGFLQGTEVLGRPVDLEFGIYGELYLSDDKAGTIYLITSD